MQQDMTESFLPAENTQNVKKERQEMHVLNYR
jgi:hypothetical protein